MATLRVRFSGLCLFHKKKGEVLVWLIQAPNHDAALWIDPQTVKVDDDPPSELVERCFVEEKGNDLEPVTREVHKYALTKGEVLSFVGGQNGPTALPGAVSLKKLHPGVRRLSPHPPLAATVRLNRGSFGGGGSRGASWHHVPGGGSTPKETPLWRDLVVRGLNEYALESRLSPAADPTRTWKLTPASRSADMLVWIGSESVKTTSDPRSGEHFQHLFHAVEMTASSVARQAPKYPYPRLDVDWPCAGVAKGIKRGERSTVGSSFCPDGQYP